MRMQSKQSSTRAGYTLIELLVVIAIIAVLISLTSAAVFQVLKKGPELNCANDLSQLDNAIASFKSDFSVDYIPNQIVIRNSYPATDITGQYFRKCFGSRVNLMNTGLVASTGIADGQPMNGNQCLVFFLGGINQQGFSPDAMNPFAAPVNPGETRKGPYFVFPAKKLNSTKQFLDPWGIPYVYMASINRAYNTNPQLNPYNMGVWAYCEVSTPPFPPKYVNAHSHQIISGGENKKLGIGSPPLNQANPISLANAPAPWTPGSGAYSPTSDGGDDYSNFHSGKLGVDR